MQHTCPAFFIPFGLACHFNSGKRTSRGCILSAPFGVAISRQGRVFISADHLQAVNAIHQSPLKFHGNIKFNKCLVDEYFGLKLTHLVTEKLKSMCPPDNREKKTRRTRHNICTSPEQLRGGVANSTTDMYAVGVIASQLLETGTPSVGVTSKLTNLFGTPRKP